MKSDADERARLVSQTDEQLMAGYQQGQQLAFEALYHRYAPRILRYLRAKSRSDKRAQDLTQEVFLKLHRSKHLYDSKFLFAPWVFSITRSVFLDAVKKKDFEIPTDAAVLDSFQSQEITPTAAEAESTELLLSLSKDQRRAVHLRVFEETSFDEIAERLSTSPENARQLFSRGLKHLKKIMTGKD